MDGPLIETERLTLRPPVAADFDAWAACAGDASAMHFIGGAQSRPLAWRGFCTTAGAWALYGFAMFSVIERSSGTWIGRLGPWKPEAWPGNEIGWGLARSAWGKGYATEGAAAAADWAFDNLGWTEIIHCIDPANTPSQAVARRLGSRNQGPGSLPPPSEGSVIDIWGQTREEWRARAR